MAVSFGSERRLRQAYCAGWSAARAYAAGRKNAKARTRRASMIERNRAK
jgi:hypothetical protein